MNKASNVNVPSGVPSAVNPSAVKSETSTQPSAVNPEMSMPDILKMAEKIAKDMPSSGSDEKLDMQGMIKHVTESVMGMMGNGDVDINGMTNSLMQSFMDPNNSQNPLAAMMEQMGQSQQSNQSQNKPIVPIANSRINLSSKEVKEDKQYKFKEPKETKNFEELGDDDDEADLFSPRTKDIDIKINVNLEDFYKGTNKKLAVRRKRLKKGSDGKITQIEEKKKIIIPIETGMRDEQVIRFNKEADEAQGYESGDIVITLYENAHSRFEREADNLFIMKDISLYEAFAASCGEDIELTVKHLDDSIIKLKTDGNPLHVNDGIRKITGEGMPKFKQDGRGDLYVRFNLVLPDKFKPGDMEILKKLFPVCNEPVNLEFHKDVREAMLEEVSESDLEELDCDYDSESDSESESSDSSSDNEPRKGNKHKTTKKK
jgi:DnaJ-class molecular chaperone